MAPDDSLVPHMCPLLADVGLGFTAPESATGLAVFQISDMYLYDDIYQLTQVVQNLNGTPTTAESYSFDLVCEWRRGAR